MTVAEAFKRHARTSLQDALRNDCFDEVISLEIEPNLPPDRPTLLIDYPASHAALARLKPSDPSVAERFELYIGGMELANAFSELIDAEEQSRRFQAEEQQRRAAGKVPYPLAEPFLNELATMPAAAGIALGIDRLVMLLCDAATIDEVVSFPPERL